MTDKELAELRRRFKPDKSNITHIRGCYVNEAGEIVSEFDQAIALMTEEEGEKFLSLLKRTLSGGLGKNLLDIPFSTEQVANSEEHRLLCALRNSALMDETAVKTFYERVIQSVSLEQSYVILLTHDRYDVPFRAKDGEKFSDGSNEVFSYILCSICPVKMTKSALGYYVLENEFHNSKLDWIVSSPELGFLFPAFDDRATNLYNALYYTRNTGENQTAFAEAIFKRELPPPAEAQKESFRALLADTLAEDCSLDLVQAVHEHLGELVEESQAQKDLPPPELTKRELEQVLRSCGVSDERLVHFDTHFDEAFGEEAILSPQNVVDAKQLDLRTPDVSVKLKPEHGDLVQTRVIDGVKYLLIRADDGVELNGLNLHIQ